jgi:hypothetical protein
VQPIQRVQIENKKSLVILANEYASRGLTLKHMATDLDLNYGSLKRGLVLRGYHHPSGIKLVESKLKAETGWKLSDYVKVMIDEGLSRNTMSKELGIDNKTLQIFADREQIIIPRSKPVPRDFQKIIAAIHARMIKRSDLFWIVHNNEKKYLSQWADSTGIRASTIKKRLSLGWSVEMALTMTTGPSKNKPCSLIKRKKIPGAKHPWRIEENLNFQLYTEKRKLLSESSS